MSNKSLGMIETLGWASCVAVADAMLKAADVRIVGFDEVGMALFTVYVEGDVSAVRIAVEGGTAYARRAGTLVAFDVIPHPQTDMFIRQAKFAKSSNPKEESRNGK